MLDHDSQPPLTASSRPSSIIDRMKFGRRRSDTTSASQKRSSKDSAQLLSQPPQANTSSAMDPPLTYDAHDWADVDVTCDNHVWHLHKEVLASRCAYFRERIAATSNESGQTPGRPLTLSVPSTEPDILTAVFRYIYTLSLDWASSAQTLHPYHFYSLIFKLSLTFAIPRLALLALSRIELKLGEVSRVDEEIMEGIPTLYALIGTGAQEAEWKEVREIVVRKTAREWGVGMRDWVSWRELVERVPEYARDAIAFLAAQSVPGGAEGVAHVNGEAGKPSTATGKVEEI